MKSRLRIDEGPSSREAAVEFLFGRIDYERARSVPYLKREFKLERMRQLLDRLGNPQQDLPIVHVAGTKGKGSTVAMLAAVFSAAGYRSGAFTSPHLDRIEQRIAVDGQPCSAEELVELVHRVRPAVETMDRIASKGDPEEIGPTYFEVTTAMALLHFVRRKVDAALLEVGLGGRLDSTNACTPRLAVITSISFDHTRQLGNTLDSIAREKAGIVKPGVPVVSGVTEEEPRAAIRQICRRRGCRLVELGVDFDFRYRTARHLEQAPAQGKLDFHYRAGGRQQAYADLSLGLLGDHQAANAAVALAVLAELRQAGWKLPEEAVRSGLAGVVWPVRVEVVSRRPAVVIDAAHNPASVDALLRVLDESFACGRRLLLFATTEEKDRRGMLRRLLSRFDRVVFTRYVDNPRAVPAAELATLAGELTGQRYRFCEEPTAAWDEIRALAGPEDLICITGSFFIAAEIRRLLAAGPPPVAVSPATTESV